jgi:hypothetical protein
VSDDEKVSRAFIERLRANASRSQKLDAEDPRARMTPAQCRAARALLNMTIVKLAGAAVVPAAAVWDYEAEIGATRPAEVDAMQDALERAGVEFIEGGVRVKGGK